MGDWAPRTVTSILEVFGTSTRPMRVETDLGEGYVKLPDSDEGPHALVAEFIGTRLAEWLGLPTFDIGAIWMPSLPLPKGGNEARSSEGLAFGSRMVRGQQWGGEDEQLRACVNPEAIAGLVVIDTWVRNPDRYSKRLGITKENVRNVFLGAEGVPGGALKLIAMDFTEAIRCGSTMIRKEAWCIEAVRDPSIFGLFPEFAPYVTPERLLPFLGRLRAFDLQLARSIVATVPREWERGDEIRQNIAGFLTERADHLTEHSASFVAAIAAMVAALSPERTTPA